MIRISLRNKPKLKRGELKGFWILDFEWAADFYGF